MKLGFSYPKELVIDFKVISTRKIGSHPYKSCMGYWCKMKEAFLKILKSSSRMFCWSRRPQTSKKKKNKASKAKKEKDAKVTTPTSKSEAKKPTILL